MMTREIFSTVIIPFKVEAGVQVVQRWILARLRNVTLFSLEEFVTAIRNLIKELNGRPFKK
jgi:hypothetical protein